MWRLKIGEGRDDPYLYSTNNFAGRQTWEFDPEAGTLEERAEVEEARQNFTKNRRQVRANSDLLWRMQVPTYSIWLSFNSHMKAWKVFQVFHKFQIHNFIRLGGYIFYSSLEMPKLAYKSKINYEIKFNKDMM